MRTKEQAKKYYLKHRRKILAQSKIRYRLKSKSIKKYVKCWVKANPDKRKRTLLKYNSTHKKELKGRYLLNSAVRDKRLKKTKCVLCGKRAHAHHDNYKYPLNVTWYCTQHHAAWHRLFIAER